MLSRREFLGYAGLAAAYAVVGEGILTATGRTPQRKLNILLIIGDDCTYNDLPVYGGQNAATPNIDQLALDGLVFNRAYLGSAMCQPCRAELYTGLYPMRNGCAWNHSASRSNVTSIPHHLQPLGYRVGLAGKVHVKPAKAFPFEKVEGFDASCVRDPTKPHDVQSIRRFIGGNQDQPFCLVVALVEPHVPWVMGDASKYRPEKLNLPPNIADTPPAHAKTSHTIWPRSPTWTDKSATYSRCWTSLAELTIRLSSLHRSKGANSQVASGPIGIPACTQR